MLGVTFTPRAIFYRDLKKQLHSTDIAVAVVVQKMIQSALVFTLCTSHYTRS